MAELPEPFFIDIADPLGRTIAAAVETPAPEARDLIDRICGRPLSMLAEPTLRAMHAIAGESAGVVIEVGAYVGGATVVLLDGAARAGTKVVSIEEPVAHDHPQIPTNNSVEDLRRNVRELSRHADRHVLLPGCSFEVEVLGRLHHLLLGRQVGFLAWDADSLIERDLALLASFLSVGCVVMIDDYLSGEAKSGRLSETVDLLVANGVLKPVALLPWATWFGRLEHPLTPATILSWLRGLDESASAGDPYCERLASYRRRVVRGEPELGMTFAERGAFWARASRWARS